MFEMLAAWGQGCAACSHPVETTRPGLEGRLCLRCRQDLPDGLASIASVPEFISEGWCLGPYSGLLGGLLRSAKYGGREDVLLELGRFLASKVQTDLAAEQFDGMATVPASMVHRLGRGFDPVELLAARLPQVLDAPLSPALRRRGGASQAGQSREDRVANVRGVYTGRSAISGRWLLIDDVLTSGATASACALALRESGASSVSLLVVAAAAGVRSL